VKALVTGAAGFIGSCLTEELLRRGADVTCLVRPSTNLRWLEHSGVNYIVCDLADLSPCAGSIRGFDYIFHLAGLTKAVAEKDFFSANADCTRSLIKVIAQNNPDLSRFVYMSSLAAAGPSLDGVPVNEKLEPRPVSAYGRSKLEGERAVLEYSDRLPVTIIRPPAVYGPRDADFLVMFRMIKNRVFPYWGEGRYSMLFVNDLVNGILLSSEHKTAGGKVYYLSDNIVYTNDDIANEIMSALETKAFKLRLPGSLMPLAALIGEKITKKGIINSDKIKELRYSNWTCDAGSAMGDLGFRPKITLREGIKWTADWYRIHRWL